MYRMDNYTICWLLICRILYIRHKICTIYEYNIGVYVGAILIFISIILLYSCFDCVCSCIQSIWYYSYYNCYYCYHCYSYYWKARNEKTIHLQLDLFLLQFFILYQIMHYISLFIDFLLTISKMANLQMLHLQDNFLRN